MSQAIRHLTRDECLTALREGDLGRIAVTHGALPVIVPVNYVVDGHDVIFRTRAGGVLDAACRHTIVAFEVDGYNAVDSTGWSVLVVGVADDDGDGNGHRPLPAAPGQREHYVRITPGTISGRALEPPDRPGSRTSGPSSLAEP